MVAAWLFVGALWSGAFNFMFPQEVATYHSPDTEYSLVFEQMGDPAWPFGPPNATQTNTYFFSGGFAVKVSL